MEKINENTKLILDYILKNGKGLKIDDIISELHLEIKKVVGAISVLKRKKLIASDAIINKQKRIIRDTTSLKSIINEHINSVSYSTQALCRVLDKKPNILNELLISTSYLPIGTATVQRLFHHIHGPIVPVCFGCGKNVKFRNFKHGYMKFCTESCSTKFEWTNKSESDRIMWTNKHRKTCMKKYGVDWYSKTDEYENKVRKTSFERYGVSRPNKSKKVKDKIKKTNIERYGGSFSGSSVIAEKIMKTIQERYGVDYSWQIPGVFDKIQSSRFEWTDYTFPSGRTVRTQGYENFGLDELLLSGINEDDIIVHTKDMSDMIGPIWYVNKKGKRSRYFPDFYIKSMNKIIEVKSTWTFFGPDHEECLKKQKACLETGLLFEFMVYHHGKRIPSDIIQVES